MHVTGVATLKNLSEIPEHAKPDLIGTKRKVGRPCKAKRAPLVL